MFKCDCLFIASLDEIASLLADLSDRIKDLTDGLCGDCDKCSEKCDISLEN